MGQNEDLQRLGIALSMILQGLPDRRFAFSANTYDMLVALDPSMTMIHVGSFKQPDGDAIMVVWIGEVSRADIEKWIATLVVKEVDVEVPVADTNPTVN